MTRAGRCSLAVACALATATACTALRSPSIVGDGADPDGAALDGPGASVDPDPADGGTEPGPALDCDGGPCVEEIVTGLADARLVAVDPQNVYFATAGTPGYVATCPKTGCTGAPLVLGPGRARSLLLVGDLVVWDDEATGEIRACAKVGCTAPLVLASDPSLRGLATDNVDIFWSTTGGMRRCTPTACAPSSIRDDAGAPSHVAASLGNLAWIDPTTRSIHTCDLPACDSVPTYSPPGDRDLLLFGSRPYWADDLLTSVQFSPSDQTTKTLLSGIAARGLAVDANFLYTRDALTGTVLECSSNGSSGLPTALDQPSLPGANLAIDGKYVYWATPTSVRRAVRRRGA